MMERGTQRRLRRGAVMSAPTIDTPPGNSQPGSPAARRRRKQLVLVASALVVLAIAVGTSLAIATRPVTRQTPAETAPTAAADPTAGADTQQNAGPDQGAPADPAAQPGSGTDPAPAANDGAAPVLPDGDTPAYITKVDAANDRIVVDVVQVFHDDEAVKAAVADGKSPSDAQYLTTWVRNVNPKLRTLPLADDLVVKLRDSCGEAGDDREALLTRLATNAAKKGTYYYTLTVDDGRVERIQERLAINAC
jgi:hypothetical protein